MIPDWSFGIREEDLQGNVEKGAQGRRALVVLLSHNGFDVIASLRAESRHR
jgi:sulfur-oxidizing protein SoxB